MWLSSFPLRPASRALPTPERANELSVERKAAPSAVLLDPKQAIARSYGALVTPHMYIVTPEGTLAYMGAIDDKPTSRNADLKGAKNFVDEALSELKQGRPVSVPTSRAYGCTVKYSS